MDDIEYIEPIGPMVKVTVTFTPEEFKKVANDAAWSDKAGVVAYVKAAALGLVTRKGC